MDRERIAAEIQSLVGVTQHMLVVCKEFLLGLDADVEYEFHQVRSAFFDSQSLPSGLLLTFQSDDPPAPGYETAATRISWELALAEAAWDLVQEGHFWFPRRASEEGVQVDTIHSRGAGTTRTQIPLPDATYGYPSNLRVRTSRRHGTMGFLQLMHPDVYVSQAGLSNADPEVVEAVRDALGCFRHGLYRASVTILGKASEGAWVEAGCSLVSLAPTGKTFTSSQKTKLLHDLRDNDHISAPRKVAMVFDHYQRKELAKDVWGASRVLPDHLRSAVVWSDTLRDARNAIHYRHTPVVPNSYEKVAVLLMDAARNLAMLYAIKSAADALASQNP
ncbi:hypothetical protein ACFLUT_03400 [Chloroflexota bacterium]